MQKYVILSAALLSLCGCVSLRHDAAPGPGSFEISVEDTEFAQALASYAAGLLEEAAHGKPSDTAADFFTIAASRDPCNYKLARRACISLLHMNRAAEAASVLENASRHIPDNIQLLIDLASVYDSAGLPDKAAGAFRKAISKDPSSSRAYIGLAGHYTRLGLMDKALETLKDAPAVAEKERFSEVALMQASALLKTERKESAVKWLEFAADCTQENSSRINLIIGEIYRSMNMHGRAERHFEIAAEGDTPIPEAIVRYALIRGEKSLSSAMEVLDSGEALFPMNELIISAVPYIAGKHRDPLTAFTLLQRINTRTLKQATESFYLMFGGSAEQAGMYIEAEQIFRAGLALYPDSHEIMNYLAYMWAERKSNLDEGEKLALKASGMQPENGAYLDTLGWIYYMQGDFEAAGKLIESALKHMPEDPTIIEHHGDILAAQGRISDAIAKWKESYRLSPANTRIRIKLEAHGASAEIKKEDL